jgi:S-adenosylmethionine:tRNA ribosyltransferase-isomerase
VKVADFDYDLPPRLIAQRPLDRRDRSRMLVLGRERGALDHRRFADLPRLLDPGDLLVLNDTRVLPARLVGRKSSGGRVELLLLEPAEVETGGESWRCWLKASRKTAVGTALKFEGNLEGRVLGRQDQEWTVRFESAGGPVRDSLRRAGRMPLPPYIRRAEGEKPPVNDRLRYQTIYARNDGAVAAPTAGLHFTAPVLNRLAERGVGTAFLTLHVGPGTFEPIRVTRVEEHRMHAERFRIPSATVEAIAATREAGGRVFAVGTTVVRTLEARAVGKGRVREGGGLCDLFIHPGHRFRVVDGMLTNFHLPRSTLLMLVSAFAGRERVLAAYREAVKREYRFYSYGDAMLVT